MDCRGTWRQWEHSVLRRSSDLKEGQLSTYCRGNEDLVFIRHLSEESNNILGPHQNGNTEFVTTWIPTVRGGEHSGGTAGQDGKDVNFNATVNTNKNTRSQLEVGGKSRQVFLVLHEP